MKNISTNSKKRKMLLHCILTLLILSIMEIKQIKAEGRDRCFQQVSDVVIVIDSSFSIRAHEFDRQLSFLKTLVDSFTIGQNHMQVGIVSFGSNVRLEIKLGQFQEKKSLKKAIDKIKHMNSGTYTNEALRFVHSQMFEEKHGGRPWAKKKVVLITDGFASDLRKTLLEASRARAKGIEIFCIGVGTRKNDMELRGMASEPKERHVFQVESYKSLSKIKAALADATCERPQKDGGSPETDEKDKVAENSKEKVADIFFLMDSSNSIWEPDFYKLIKFIRQVTSRFVLGQDAIRVGFVVYSHRPVTLLSLGDTQTKFHINRVLDHIRYMSGGSNTAKAVMHVRKYGFTVYNKRPNCAKIMVLLTDGKSDNQQETVEQAEKAKKEGVKIFSIGVGENTDSQELMEIASDPDDKFVFHVDDYDHLPTIKDLLVVKASDVAEKDMIKDEPGQSELCPKLPSDVVFIYDVNSLSRRHHNTVINAISNVIESKILFSKNLRFGVIREVFQNHQMPLQDIKLTQNWKRAEFRKKLDPGSKNSSSVELLLKKARKAWDGEKTNKKVVVVFLDSGLENIFAASLETSRLKRSDTRIIIVGLGKHFDPIQGLFLVSHPARKNLILPKERFSRDSGNVLVDDIIRRLCAE